MHAAMAGAVRLDNQIQPYPWGSKTAIPRLFGRPASDSPQAEMWIGAHPKCPSFVETVTGRVPLDRWIADDPEARLGPDVDARFGALPFLLKYLAAAEPLSIQCHPNAAQARAGFAREEAAGIPIDAHQRTYRDANPKPELIVARGRFEALKGFRKPEDIQALLGALKLPDLPGLLAPLSASADREGLAMFYRGLMRKPHEAKTRLAMAAVRAARTLQDRNPAFKWVVRLGEAYPGDVGVLSPLLLEYIRLEQDEGLYLGAGELHAYLGGEGIEVMANSDNVVRGGLTQKHVDVGELLDLLTFDYSSPNVMQPKCLRQGVYSYNVPVDHFTLSLLRPEADRDVEIAATGRPAIALALAGQPTLQIDGSSISLTPGQSVFAPPSRTPSTLRGACEVAWVGVGAANL